MPYYDFLCLSCNKPVHLFFTYSEYDEARPICSHCQSAHLRRLVRRVALAKSEDARMETLIDDNSLAGLDEEDPKALGHFMRKMSREMGEDLGEEFEEVVDRLEKGESPEAIEESMPDLGGGLGDGL